MNKRIRLNVTIVLSFLLVVTALAATPASAAPIPPESPGTTIQTWTVNIKHLGFSWKGLIDKMMVAPFAPDIVLGQEMSSAEAQTFVNEMNLVFGSRFIRESSTGNNTVIWNTNRFTKIASSSWPQQTNGCGDGTTAMSVNLRDTLATSLFLETRNIVAASLHFPVENIDPDACVQHSLFQANQNLDNLASVRRMTIIGGDFNERVDNDLIVGGYESPSNGLEADPDCWYEKFSAAHQDLPVLPCGTGSQDRYYDTVWIYPLGGGTTNPMITSACHQYTHSRILQPVAPELKGATNSCTDLVNNASGDAGPDGKLDKGRIDFIWTSYENTAGAAWKPPAAAIVPFVSYASADLGLSLDADVDSIGRSYSDHRAVNSLLEWPPLIP